MNVRLLLTAVLVVVCTSFVPDRNNVKYYARCVGSSPCRACSNCSSCNWCNSGGRCGICARQPKKPVTEKRALQCQATTKKGKQCSRAAKSGSKYCWQHG